MSRIYYEVPILDDEGNQISEFPNAIVDCEVKLENGIPVVYVDHFMTQATNGKWRVLSFLDGDASMRTMFLRSKEFLENDTSFINYADSHDEDIVFHGLGANDPDGKFVKVAA